MNRCPQCSADTPGGRCIFCGYDLPVHAGPTAGITWGLRATGLGCGGLFLCFLGLLVWGMQRPSLEQRNQRDHPALVQAREMLKKRRYSAALDSLHRAPSLSAYTADLRGLAMLGMNGNRRGAGFSSLLRAREAFEEAVGRDPEVAPTLLHLAACQAVLGEKKEVVLATLDTCAKLPVEGETRRALEEVRGLVHEGKPFTVSLTPVPSRGSQVCVLLPIGH